MRITEQLRAIVTKADALVEHRGDTEWTDGEAAAVRLAHAALDAVDIIPPSDARRYRKED